MGKKIRLKKKYRIYLNIIISILCVFVLLGGGYFAYDHFFIQDSQDIEKVKKVGMTTNSSIEEEQENLDIIALGNSDLYSSWNPLQLFHEKGITSYVGAGAKSNTKLAYYIFREVLSVSSPKLLVIEANALFDEREYIEDQGYEYTATKYCSKLFENTEKWDDIKNESYMNENFNKNRMKLYGYYYSNDVVPNYIGFSYMKKTQERTEFSSFTKKYLPKIMDLCQQNNMKVLFIAYPSERAWDYKKYNTVNDYATENNIPFIDFNIETNLTTFDWLTDSRDGGNHLNHSGATKMTSFLGNYIAKHYQFEDHRKSSLYNSWKESYNSFIKEFVEY